MLNIVKTRPDCTKGLHYYITNLVAVRLTKTQVFPNITFET